MLVSPSIRIHLRLNYADLTSKKTAVAINYHLIQVLRRIVGTLSVLASFFTRTDVRDSK